MSLPLVSIGHSHLAAFIRSYQVRFRKNPNHMFLTDLVGQDLVVSEGGREVPHPKIREHLEQHPAEYLLASIGGNEHNIVGLCGYLLPYDKMPYDFVLPAEPDLPRVPRAVPMPYIAVRTKMAGLLKDHFRLLTVLASYARMPVLQLEAPPPNPDDAWIRDHAEPSVADFVRGGSIAPAMLRYKLWRTQCALYRDHCAKLGITYLPTPAVAFGPDRLLAREAWYDATHANNWYGDLLIDQIATAAEAIRARTAP